MTRNDGFAVAWVAFVIALFLSTACDSCSKQPAKQPTPLDVSDAGEPVMTDDCAADCAAWLQQGCSEGQPTSLGTSCTDVCENAWANGIDTSHQLSCATKATTCAVHRACPY